MFAQQQQQQQQPGVVLNPQQQLETGACAGSQQQQGLELFKQAAAFSTTQDFTTTHGFFISTPPLASGAAAAAAAAAPPATAGRPPTSSSSCSDGSSRSDAAVEQNNVQPSDKPSTPVGWSGLLEISRGGGGPGLMGSVSGGSDQELEGHVEVACTAHASTGVRRLVKSVVRGIKARQDPEAAREGMGGTYFFTNEAGRKVAIFKPCDEEPLAPANPKGYVGRNLGDPGWKSTVRVGEAAMREVAAYLLDHDHYAQVPHTVLVRARHPAFNYKYAACSTASSGTAGASTGPSNMSARTGSVCSMVSVSTAADTPAGPRDSTSSGEVGGNSGADQLLKLGSLQEFVYHIADTSDFGASRFRSHDVHAIGILDIRLFNTDRHAGNILVRQPQLSGSCRDLSAFSNGSTRTLGSRAPSFITAAASAAVASSEYELIPIDHGFCLPEALEAPYFEWLHWPQACLPFSDEELRYIARLDAAADIALLQQELPNLRPECLRVLEVSTNFLQRCAAAGLSLADIGALASRPLDALDGDDSNPSELEKACVAARQAVETRELTASMMSSSYSSDSFPTAVLEEDEEDLLETGDCSSELEAAEQEQRSMAGSPMVLGSSQHQPLHRPSRLGVVTGACSSMELPGEQADRAAAGQVPLAAAGKQGSGASEATTCNLATAMSLGRQAADGDLLFDLDDDSGSSAANTPVSSGALAARAGSPLGRRLPAAAGGSGSIAAAGVPAAAAAAGAGDVVMAAAGSLREAEALSQYLRVSMQLQPVTTSAFTGMAAAAGDSSGGDGGGAAAAAPLRADSGSSAGLCSPLSQALSTPVSQAVPVARSMQVSGDGGWMFRDLNANPGMATVGRCLNVKKSSAAGRCGTGVHKAMYPPPVIRAPPRATNEVLSGLSDKQWQAFMKELLSYMDDALRPGKGAWRGASQAAGLGTVAMSCPRF